MPTFSNLTVNEVATYFTVRNNLIYNPYTDELLLSIITNPSSQLLSNSELIHQQSHTIRYHFPHYYGTKTGSSIQYYQNNMILSAFNTPADTIYYYQEHVMAIPFVDIITQLNDNELMQLYMQLYMLYNHFTTLNLCYDLSNLGVIKLATPKLFTYRYNNTTITFLASYLLKFKTMNSGNHLTMYDITNNIIQVVTNEKFLLLLQQQMDKVLLLLQGTGGHITEEDILYHHHNIEHIISLFNYNSLLNRYLAGNLTLPDTKPNKYLYQSILPYCDLYKRILLLPNDIVIDNKLITFKEDIKLLLILALDIMTSAIVRYKAISNGIDMEQKIAKIHQLQKFYNTFLTYGKLL